MGSRRNERDYMAYLNRLSCDHWSLRVLKPAQSRRFVRSFLVQVGHSIHTACASFQDFIRPGWRKLRDVAKTGKIRHHPLLECS
jgi:hypothetical protein